MDELAKLLAPHMLAMSEDYCDVPLEEVWTRPRYAFLAGSIASAADAVRAYLSGPEVLERMAKAHCDYFGGEGWWETGLLADTLPKGRDAMRAALDAAGGKQDG